MKVQRKRLFGTKAFGEDFYIELQDHGLEGDKIVMEQAPRLARELGIRLYAPMIAIISEKKMQSLIMFFSISKK